MEISWNFVSPKKWEPCIVIGGQLKSRLNMKDFTTLKLDS